MSDKVSEFYEDKKNVDEMKNWNSTLKEWETNNVQCGRIIGVYSDLDITYSSGDKAQSIVIAYELLPIGGELVCDLNETMELRYFSREEKPVLFTQSHEDLWNDFFIQKGE